MRDNVLTINYTFSGIVEKFSAGYTLKNPLSIFFMPTSFVNVLEFQIIH